jgi:hypothetical protein
MQPLQNSPLCSSIEIEQQNYFFSEESVHDHASNAGGHKEMSSTLAPSYMSPNAGEGVCGVSANENSCTHGAQINFGDLTPYLTYDPMC